MNIKSIKNKNKLSRRLGRGTPTYSIVCLFSAHWWDWRQVKRASVCIVSSSLFPFSLFYFFKENKTLNYLTGAWLTRPRKMEAWETDGARHQNNKKSAAAAVLARVYKLWCRAPVTFQTAAAADDAAPMSPPQ